MKILHIYPKIFIILFLIFPAAAESFTLSSPYTDASEKTVKGISNVASSIISDSFVPMTHYNRGDGTVTLVPAYFKINRAFDDPSIKGNKLQGWALGLGGGYALTDRWMIYGILSYLGVFGNMEGRFLGDNLGEFTAAVNYSLVSCDTGVGFDILSGNGRWSIPVFMGISLRYFRVDFDTPPTTFSGGDSGEVDFSGNGILFGFSGGFAVSVKLFELFRITPYFLYTNSFNKPEIEIEGYIDTITLDNFTENVAVDNIGAGMFGLDFSVIATSSFSFSLNIGGLITSSTSFYNKAFLNGLNMLSIVASITYSFKLGKEKG